MFFTTIALQCLALSTAAFPIITLDFNRSRVVRGFKLGADKYGVKVTYHPVATDDKASASFDFDSLHVVSGLERRSASSADTSVKVDLSIVQRPVTTDGFASVFSSTLKDAYNSNVVRIVETSSADKFRDVDFDGADTVPIHPRATTFIVPVGSLAPVVTSTPTGITSAPTLGTSGTNDKLSLIMDSPEGVKHSSADKYVKATFTDPMATAFIVSYNGIDAFVSPVTAKAIISRPTLIKRDYKPSISTKVISFNPAQAYEMATRFYTSHFRLADLPTMSSSNPKDDLMNLTILSNTNLVSIATTSPTRSKVSLIVTTHVTLSTTDTDSHDMKTFIKRTDIVETGFVGHQIAPATLLPSFDVVDTTAPTVLSSSGHTDLLFRRIDDVNNNTLSSKVYGTVVRPTTSPSHRPGSDLIPDSLFPSNEHPQDSETAAARFSLSADETRKAIEKSNRTLIICVVIVVLICVLIVGCGCMTNRIARNLEKQFKQDREMGLRKSVLKEVDMVEQNIEDSAKEEKKKKKMMKEWKKKVEEARKADLEAQTVVGEEMKEIDK